MTACCILWYNEYLEIAIGISDPCQGAVLSEGEETMKDFLQEDEDFELWWLILGARRAMHKARARELSQYDITPEEAAVLFVVQTVGRRATPAEISRWLLRESHSISGLIQRMEKEGLVKKVKDLDRKNLVRVAMTEKGQQAYYQSTKRDSVHRIISSISKEERQHLRATLERLRDKALKEIGIAFKPPFPPSR